MREGEARRRQKSLRILALAIGRVERLRGRERVHGVEGHAFRFLGEVGTLGHDFNHEFGVNVGCGFGHFAVNVHEDHGTRIENCWCHIVFLSVYVATLPCLFCLSSPYWAVNSIIVPLRIWRALRFLL